MSPQFTIITAAMSLGGMASVGFNHYGQVEKQVVAHRMNLQEEKEQLEVAEVGERVETVVADLKENFRVEREKDRETFASMLREVAVEVEMVKEQQSTHNVLMQSLSREQETLNFKIGSFSEKFRPLRATESRFQPVKSDSGEAHSLLPPLEPSWTEQY